MSTTQQASPSLRERAPELLFGLLLAVHLLPVVLLRWFPTQDGPAHVATVMALLRRDASPTLQEYFVPNWGAQPNWLTQLLFAGLVRWLPPADAQRVILAGFVALFPMAFRAAMPATRRGRWAALCAFPFVYSYPFHMGFWNFSYGLVLLFAIVAAWRRWRGRLTTTRGVVLAGLLVVAYFCHTSSVAAALAALGSTVAWRAAVAFARARGTPRRRRLVLRAYAARAAAIALAALPALALLGRFLVLERNHPPLRDAPLALAGKLASLYALVSFDRREVLLSFPIAVVLAAAVAHRLRARSRSRAARARPADAWLGAAAFFAVLYFAVPDVTASGAQINDRLALLPYLFVVLWLGTAAGRARDVRRIAVPVAALSVVALALRAPRYLAAERDLREVIEATRQLPRDAVVLPLTFAPYGFGPDGARRAYRVRAFQHVLGYAAAERDLVDLDLSQASTDHAPVRFPRGLDAYRALGGDVALEGDPPCFDLEGWLAAGARVDAVVVFAPAAATTPCARRMLAALGAGYDRVAVSGPHGLVELHLARGRAPAVRAASGRAWPP